MLPGGRKVDEPGAVVLTVDEAPLDHDVEELADARWRRRGRQLLANLLDGRAPAAVEDLHDLALAPRQRRGIRHGRPSILRRIFSLSANIFATTGGCQPPASACGPEDAGATPEAASAGGRRPQCSRRSSPPR